MYCVEFTLSGVLKAGTMYPLRVMAAGNTNTIYYLIAPIEPLLLIYITIHLIAPISYHYHCYHYHYNYRYHYRYHYHYHYLKKYLEIINFQE